MSSLANGAKTLMKPMSSGPLRQKSPSLLEQKTLGALVFEDGTVIEGWHFGADKSMSGQLVFSTNMTGYVESMTDLMLHHFGMA